MFDADRNSGEPENTYILRPIFQQRRVADGARRAGDVGQQWGSGHPASPRRRGEGRGWGGLWRAPLRIGRSSREP